MRREKPLIPQSWKKTGSLLLIAGLLVIVIFFGWLAFQFNQSVQQSERHNFHYSIDLSYSTTLENVTILLPAPQVNETPFLTGSQLAENLYGIPADWNLSVETVNGTPMIAIRADRMVPVYQGRPIAIEPGQSPLPTTLVPGTEYSADTPILQPVHIAMMIPVNRTINTKSPVGNENLLAPSASFIPSQRASEPYTGTEYTYTVPVYVQFTSATPARVSLSTSIEGTNSIWKGGWVYNEYSDRVILESVEPVGWIDAEGVLRTGGGVYY